MKTKKAFFCLPVQNESANLPRLLENLKNQQTTAITHLIVCVNQPERWRSLPEKQHVVADNEKSIKILLQEKNIPVTVIDRSSKGKGWDDKHFGVGWARKTVMDLANSYAGASDYIFSIDADTYYPPTYTQAAIETLKNLPDAMALAIPYYHPLTGKPAIDRQMLHYELYMRHYALNMWRISSPYKFTALGSAIALPVWAYRKVGGITPKTAGEDFYFLQKLRKSGQLAYFSTEKAFPATRYSDRVLFGTGPALIKGARGNWESYPFYHPTFFDEVKRINDAFANYFFGRTKTPVLEKLRVIFDNLKWIDKIAQNTTQQDDFVRKCQMKFDGLKTLQYLKARQSTCTEKENNILSDYLHAHYSFPPFLKGILNQLDFEISPVEDLQKIRNFLVSLEYENFKHDYNLRTHSNW
jgi:glycosyltransferase involved in cell wall biosynthesis